VEVLGHLRGSDRARTAHRFLDCRAHLGVQLVKGLLHGLGRHAEILGTNMVEFLAEIAQGRSASGFDVVEDRADEFTRLVGPHFGPRHRLKHLGTGQALAAQVDDSHGVIAHTHLW
jgi:hypothetical protein